MTIEDSNKKLGPIVLVEALGLLFDQQIENKNMNFGFFGVGSERSDPFCAQPV